jgi:O-antigen ligase
MAANVMIGQLSPLSIRTYLGHGYNTAAIYMRDMINISSKFSYNVSTVDNGFISVLYDFGVIGFILYCIPLVLSFIGIFKDTNRNERCIDCIIFTIMVSSFFFEAVYWDNISFILMTLLGFKMHYMENKGRDTCQTQNP